MSQTATNSVSLSTAASLPLNYHLTLCLYCSKSSDLQQVSATELFHIMASRKRPAPELDNYTDITEPFQTANLHGVLKTLSPVKKGKTCRYFDGVLTDGTSTMRLVGFRQDQQKRLITFSENKTPISLQDCQIKVSRQGNQMEALLKNGTKISPSTRKFDIPEGDDADTSAAITMAEIQEIQPFDKVSASVKVLHKKRSHPNPRRKDKARHDRWRSHVHHNCYSVGGICGHYVTRQ